MNETELKEIEARYLATTQAEWLYEKGYVLAKYDAFYCTVLFHAGWDGAGNTHANFSFVAHAHQDVPKLLEEVRLLQARLRHFEEIGGE